jgi:hypothetical protein
MLIAVLVIAALTFNLAVLWVRAARLPATRGTAIASTVICLVVLGVLLTNVGGLGSRVGELLARLPPIFVLVWAGFALAELVQLGIEVNRLARARTHESDNNTNAQEHP